MKVITIGRSSQNEVVLLDDKVSRHHCQIILHDDGHYSIADLGSTNGTFVNGRRIQGETVLNPGDVVSICGDTIPWQNYFGSATVPGPTKTVTMGRASDNDVVISDSFVGRHHCRFAIYGNGYVVIEDLNSANGTFVNGQRIQGQRPLNPSDIVRIGNTTLPWPRYVGIWRGNSLPPQQPTKSNTKKWIFGSIGAAAMLVAAILLIVHLVNHKPENIFFEGEYPPVAQVQYEDGGVTYNVEAIQGQVMVYFDENVSHRSAVSAIEDAGGKVVAQMPETHYYLVDAGASNENSFIKNIRSSASVSYAYPNAVSYPCRVSKEVIDNFSYIYPGDKASHGKMVSFALNCDAESHVGVFDAAINEKKKSLNRNIINESIYKILSNADTHSATIINMSFGQSLKVDTVERMWYDTEHVNDSKRKEYRKNYINLDIIPILQIIKQFDAKDFIIVKAAGNTGVKDFENNILNSLTDSIQKKNLIGVMNRHVLLVSAKDDREDWAYPTKDKKYRSLYNGYSNELKAGTHHPWVTKVDITDFKYEGKDAAGTSYASPRAGCFIANAIDKHNISAVEALQYAREATRLHPQHLLTPEMLDSLIAADKGEKQPEPEPDENGEYIDLGLPSGTLWKTCKEKEYCVQCNDENLRQYGQYSYDEAMQKFGKSIPTKKEFEELVSKCKWVWNGKGYQVTGPNGKSITMPILCADYDFSDKEFNESNYYFYELGMYWSSTSNGPNEAWVLHFDSGIDGVDIRSSSHDDNDVCSVWLVKRPENSEEQLYAQLEQLARIWLENYYSRNLITIKKITTYEFYYRIIDDSQNKKWLSGQELQKAIKGARELPADVISCGSGQYNVRFDRTPQGINGHINVYVKKENGDWKVYKMSSYSKKTDSDDYYTTPKTPQISQQQLTSNNKGNNSNPTNNNVPKTYKFNCCSDVQYVIPKDGKTKINPHFYDIFNNSPEACSRLVSSKESIYKSFVFISFCWDCSYGRGKIVNVTDVLHKYRITYTNERGEEYTEEKEVLPRTFSRMLPQDIGQSKKIDIIELF